MEAEDSFYDYMRKQKSPLDENVLFYIDEWLQQGGIKACLGDYTFCLRVVMCIMVRYANNPDWFGGPDRRPGYLVLDNGTLPAILDPDEWAYLAYNYG
ncbi:hypothetical protein [Labedaea rhizosphaerae]|nr:hypothetical protein [Labedaea rhizosphaerae]